MCARRVWRLSTSTTIRRQKHVALVDTRSQVLQHPVLVVISVAESAHQNSGSGVIFVLTVRFLASAASSSFIDGQQQASKQVACAIYEALKSSIIHYITWYPLFMSRLGQLSYGCWPQVQPAMFVHIDCIVLCPAIVHSSWYLGSHPAPCRHEGQQGDCGYQ